MAEFKERTDNPLHRKFGIWSNTRYILAKCRQYCPSVIPIAVMGVVCGSVLGYFWGIFGKYVIDLIQSGISEEESVRALLRILAVGGAVAAVLLFGNTYSDCKTWYRYIFVRMRMITERVDKALRLDYEMLEKPEILDVQQRAQQATGGNNNGVEGMMHLMAGMATSLFTVLITFGAVCVLDFRLILVLILLGILQGLHYNYVVKLCKREVWDKLAPVWRQEYYMNRVTQDFDYAKDIRLFRLTDFLLGKQRKVFEKKEERMDYHYNQWFRHALLVRGVYLVGSALIYGVLVYSVLRKGMSIGNFTLYLTLAMSFSGSLSSFLQSLGEYGKASLEVDDFRTFLELEMGDGKDALPLPEAEDYVIEFHDVGYCYLKAEKNALEHLNLTLHAGEKLAVVGINGAGKSTMIKLLLRLYDPTEGYITLNGVDIRRYRREDYYRLFSPVFQNVEVMAFPVAENVSMKVREETDFLQALSALREAGLGEKLEALPKGIETELLKIVDEEGVDLSGGEKQKLALARALYKAAPIVVLDEPTSALDALAEQQLYERFDHMIGEKSAVYISHRLASTRFCDCIAMFKDGHMIELGSHEELMAQGGEYAHMFEVQAQYYREEQEVEADA